MHTVGIDSTRCSELFHVSSLVRGQPVLQSAIRVAGCELVIESGPARTIRLIDEWYQDIAHPKEICQALRALPKPPADLFSFWQRIPDVEPRFDYLMQKEQLAVLGISNYDHWWEQQIKSRVRTRIRKCYKEGVEVRETNYDEEFVRGITAIFNETPIRQGRKFWHYGKTEETVRKQFSRFIHRETMIGAYYQDKLVGFVMLGNAGRYGLTGQVISSIRHRDKAVNNVLIAASVKACSERGLPALVYFFWGDDSLTEFKRRCGFEPVSVPRYFVPLTRKGEAALRLGLHKGWRQALPSSVRNKLKRIRNYWNQRRNELV